MAGRAGLVAAPDLTPVRPTLRAFATACALAAAPADRAAAQATYTNPLADSLEVADPFVLRDGDGLYYLYGTSAADGFRAWTSRDLVSWESIGHVYRAPDTSWARRNFWAPEVLAYRGRYYLSFSAKGPGEAGLRLCLAVADHPAGPFRDLAVPWLDRGFSAIDAHLYVDADGTPYAYYEMVGVVGEPWAGRGYFRGSILGEALAPDLLAPARPDAPPVRCLWPSQPWELPPDGLAHSVEGMTVFRVDGVYYMTYSANHYKDPRYGIGYATARAPLGPWVKPPDNPLLARDTALLVSGPGHNGIAVSPDGRERFLVYHSHADAEAPSARRILNLDRLVVAAPGRLTTTGPTRSPQPSPSGAPPE